MIKTNFLFLILLIFLVACQLNTKNEVEPSNPEKMIKNTELQEFANHPIMFYNTENLFDTEDDRTNEGDNEFLQNGPKLWDEKRYSTKLSNIEEALFFANGESPLMCGFAEIENRKVLEDLIKVNRFAQVNYKIVHFDSEDARGIDCGFIYDADRFSPSLETRLTIRLEDNPNFRTRDILYIKGVLASGEELNVFVNHWSSRREGEQETEPRRIAAAKTLRLKVDEILAENSNANIIILGDFNDTPVNKSLYEVLRAKGQNEQKPGDLINLFIEEQKHDLGTAVHRGDWDVLDNLIVSQGLLQGKFGLTVKDNNAFIVRNEKLLYTYKDGNQKPSSTFGGDQYYGGYSDHLPVYVLLEVKNK